MIKIIFGLNVYLKKETKTNFSFKILTFSYISLYIIFSSQADRYSPQIYTIIQILLNMNFSQKKSRLRNNPDGLAFNLRKFS